MPATPETQIINKKIQPYMLKGASLLGIMAAFLWPLTAQAYNTFSCGSGTELTNVEVLSQSGGWDTAKRLVDDDQYSGWATNFPGSATAKYTLGTTTTVTEVHFYVSPTHASSGSILVETRHPGGAQGEVKNISVTGAGWHHGTFSDPNIDHVKLIRDTGENAFEMKICAGTGSALSQVSVEDISVNEGDGAASINVTVSPPSPTAFSVQIDTANGSAIAPGDYTDTSAILQFVPNEVSKLFDVPIIDDADIESTENFNVALSSPSGVAIGNANAVVTIMDNDSVTSQCDSGATYNPMAVPQACLPDQMGVAESMSFGEWRDRIDGGTLDYASSGEDCRDLHDRYWVKGDDEKAYHTWHPPVAQNCVFRHEHGDDPSTSNIFTFAEWYPPFGYAMSQQMTHGGGGGHDAMRHEAHFGHKVVVANDIRLAVGKPQDEKDVTKLGVTCNWLSKIHQGTYSADAMTNHLHEYFLNVKCADEVRDDRGEGKGTITEGDKTDIIENKSTQKGSIETGAEGGSAESNNNIEFAVKVLAQWGKPNEVHIIGVDSTSDALTEIKSEILRPWDGLPDLLDPDYLATPSGAGGQREFEKFKGFQHKDWASPSAIRQPELWSGNSDYYLDIPLGGTVKFAPYYAIKNPGRLLLKGTDPNNPDIKYILKPTVEWCYKDHAGRPKIDGDYCDILPDVYPGPDYWKTAESPFNGTVRSLNFKDIRLENLNGPLVFCTDSFGFNPTDVDTNGKCPGKVRQRASNGSTSHWDNVNGTSADASGTIESWTFGYANGTWVSERLDPTANPDGTYPGAGIGFEWIINHGNAEGVRVPN